MAYNQYAIKVRGAEKMDIFAFDEESAKRGAMRLYQAEEKDVEVEERVD